MLSLMNRVSGFGNLDTGNFTYLAEIYLLTTNLLKLYGKQ